MFAPPACSIDNEGRRYLTFLHLWCGKLGVRAEWERRQQRTCFSLLHHGLSQTQTLLSVLAKHPAQPSPAPRNTPSALRAMLMILLTSIKFGFPTAKIFVKCRSISKIVDSSRGREMSICPFELVQHLRKLG